MTVTASDEWKRSAAGRCARMAVALTALLAPAPTLHAHEMPVTPLVVGSTGAGGGALRIVRGSNDPVPLAETAESGGFVLYTAADPSFEVPEGGETDVFPILDGTEVRVELVAAAETAAIKLRGATLLAAGDTVVLGTAPALHAHPEWQLTLPAGAVDCQSLRFRLSAAGYEPSEPYTLQLANDVHVCGASADVCGDADGSGAVTVTDGVAVLRTAAGLGGGCVADHACDVDANGSVSVTDGVNVLRAAAGLATELTCPDR